VPGGVTTAVVPATAGHASPVQLSDDHTASHTSGGVGDPTVDLQGVTSEGPLTYQLHPVHCTHHTLAHSQAPSPAHAPPCRCFIEGLVMGNMQAEQAAAISRQVDEALAAAAGGSSIWPGEGKDVRVVKLPQGPTHLWSEPGPNPANDNSAVVVVFQVRCWFCTQCHSVWHRVWHPLQQAAVILAWPGILARQHL
jgi:hypothetical protein